MTEFVKVGEKIEGAKTEIYCRKESFKGLHKDPLTLKPMIKYEMCRNSTAEITEELFLSEDELEIRRRLNVALQVGDKLNADAITVFVDQKRPLKCIVKEGLTHTHGGHLFSTSNRTIGIIKYTHPNLMHLLQTNKKQITL